MRQTLVCGPLADFHAAAGARAEHLLLPCPTNLQNSLTKLSLQYLVVVGENTSQRCQVFPFLLVEVSFGNCDYCRCLVQSAFLNLLLCSAQIHVETGAPRAIFPSVIVYSELALAFRVIKHGKDGILGSGGRFDVQRKPFWRKRVGVGRSW